MQYGLVFGEGASSPCFSSRTFVRRAIYFALLNFVWKNNTRPYMSHFEEAE